MSSAAPRRFDSIVIGSGIGGLTAALLLAVRGRSVVVLEAAKELGGYTNPFRRGPYSFDPGVHYIGECGPDQAFTRILEALFLDAEVRFRELSPEGFDRIVFPGYEITMPRGAELYKSRLIADFPHERDGLDTFFDLLRALHDAAGVRDPARPDATFMRGAPQAARKLAPYLRATLRELLDAHLKDPLLKAVLAAQGGNYGLPPGRASALVGLGVLDHYLSGAYFPVGGSGALRDAFVRAIERRGGVLHRRRTIQKILVKGGRVAGVRCADGEEIMAPTVISNASATATYLSLLGRESLPSSIRDKAEGTRPSLSSVCLFLGTTLDVAAAGMTDANIWHSSSIDIDASYEPLFAGELPAEDFFFLSSPSLKDPGSLEGAGVAEDAPPRHRLELVALAPYGPFSLHGTSKPMQRGPDYVAMKRRLADRYLELMERYVPSIGRHIDVLEISTPVTNLHYACAPFGSIYGPDHAPDQYGLRRFSAQGAIPGLFLCGASVLGGGIVPSAMSGFAAASLATSPSSTTLSSSTRRDR